MQIRINWIRRFIEFRGDAPIEGANAVELLHFVEHIAGDERYADWQIRQAGESVSAAFTEIFPISGWSKPDVKDPSLKKSLNSLNSLMGSA